MKNKTEEVKKELDPIMAELIDLAKTVVKDFKEIPTDISGSTIQIHEDSPYLDENLPDKGWDRVLTSMPLDKIKKSAKK